jgi:hypothetical protein
VVRSTTSAIFGLFRRWFIMAFTTDTASNNLKLIEG